MGDKQVQGDRIEALWSLVDRLGSPDLKLGEAKALRCRLLELTGRVEESGPIRSTGLPAARPGTSCEGHRHGSRLLGCRGCAA